MDNLLKNAHRHHLALGNNGEDVWWLCQCKEKDFLPGEKETIEKIFREEVKKQPDSKLNNV